MRKPLAIIGMSPGNSYFKDYEVRFLLQQAVSRFGNCAIMVADVPAIATYKALGYSPSQARNKAIPKGNNLKNRTRRLAEELGYSEEQVRIVDWAEEVETNPGYQQHYRNIAAKYQTMPAFAEGVRKTSRTVLEASGKIEGDIVGATESATHYLLSELAFMEFAPAFFACERVCYLYHRNWPIYEDYIQGQFDMAPKPYLDFLLLEAPYETYAKLNDQDISEGIALHDTYSRVMQSGVLRAAFVDYPPVFHYSDKGFSGIFYEVFAGFAQFHNLKIDWVEQTGYGVIIEGLAEGRYDIFGSAAWPTPDRHCKAALSHPLYYSDVGVWVRADSPLAHEDWLRLDDPRYRVAITEGDITHAISLTDFTRAKWIRAPQLGKVKALFELVADGRANATMAERLTYEAYAPDLSHPLINIAHLKPIRRYANSFLVGKHQNDFKDLLDNYIINLFRQGTVQALVEKYNCHGEGLYYPNLI